MSLGTLIPSIKHLYLNTCVVIKEKQYIFVVRTSSLAFYIIAITDVNDYMEQYSVENVDVKWTEFN